MSQSVLFHVQGCILQHNSKLICVFSRDVPIYLICCHSQASLFIHHCAHQQVGFTALPTSSLVYIHAAGTYKGALGYVIGASTNPANACAIIAVVPKIKCPNIHYLSEDQHHVILPQRKHTKLKSSSYHPHLFDLSHLLIRELNDKISLSSDIHTVVYDNGFQCYFKTRFPSIHTDSMEHQLNLDNFLFQVHQHKSDYAVTNKLSSRLKGMNVEIIGRTSPVYRYCGHLYYLGFHIILIFQCLSLALNHHFQVDKVLPFVKSHLAPGVFNPIISWMHWKRGDKLVDVTQNAKYPFYCIHRVGMEEGVMVAHLVLMQGDKEDAQELWSSGVHVDINCLPHEYTLHFNYGWWLGTMSGLLQACTRWLVGQW